MNKFFKGIAMLSIALVKTVRCGINTIGIIDKSPILQEDETNNTTLNDEIFLWVISETEAKLLHSKNQEINNKLARSFTKKNLEDVDIFYGIIDELKKTELWDDYVIYETKDLRTNSFNEGVYFGRTGMREE